MEGGPLPGEKCQRYSLEQSMRWKTQVLKVRLIKELYRSLLSKENELLRLLLDTFSPYRKILNSSTSSFALTKGQRSKSPSSRRSADPHKPSVNTLNVKMNKTQLGNSSSFRPENEQVNCCLMFPYHS